MNTFVYGLTHKGWGANDRGTNLVKEASPINDDHWRSCHAYLMGCHMDWFLQWLGWSLEFWNSLLKFGICMDCILAGISECSSFALACSPNTHVVKVWFPVYSTIRMWWNVCVGPNCKKFGYLGIDFGKNISHWSGPLFLIPPWKEQASFLRTQVKIYCVPTCREQWQRQPNSITSERTRQTSCFFL